MKLPTTHIRAEHFGDGHFASMIECGHIAAILERLADLQRHASQRFTQSDQDENDMKKPEPPTTVKEKKNALLVGSMGLYAVCYELSKRGWNVMPTSRNAKGIDILGYDQSGKRTITVQVKALSKAAPVPLGTDPTHCNLIAEFIVIARGVRQQPEFFVAKVADVLPLVHVGKKNGKTSCWLWLKVYQKFEGKWETIGEGW